MTSNVIESQDAVGAKPRVTIIVSPRERFRMAIGSLEKCLRTADVPFKLVYVDGGSPKPISTELKRLTESSGHTYLRFDGYITPSFARNAALPFVDTDFVAFIDNDVAFQPGWLSALVRCADETGAGLVTPTILVGPSSKAPDLKIHHAGGILDLTPTDAGLVMHRRHGFEHLNYRATADQLVRGETASTEFHVVLARTAMLYEIGEFDNNVAGFTDEIDMAFNAKQHGWKIFFEPASVVVYDVGKSITWQEIPFFCLRWSGIKCMRSEKYFYKKWGLVPDFERQRGYLRDHRRHAFPLRRMQSILGWKFTVTFTSWLCEAIALLAEPMFIQPTKPRLAGNSPLLTGLPVRTGETRSIPRPA